MILTKLPTMSNLVLLWKIIEEDLLERSRRDNEFEVNACEDELGRPPLVDLNWLLMYRKPLDVTLRIRKPLTWLRILFLFSRAGG